MVKMQAFLKGQEVGVALFLFNLFKVYHFYIQKLPLAKLNKNYFFLSP